MALSRRFLMICVVAISAVPTTASAAPIFWSQVITSALTVVGGVCQPNTGCSDSDNSGQQLSVDTLGPQTSTAQGATGGQSTGFASVVDGVLHASASGVGGASFFDGWNASGQAFF